MIPCGRCSTSGAWGSFFVAGTVLCRPLQKRGWDLGTLGLSDRSRCGAMPILKLLTQPLSALWACQIALVVALCSVWDCSLNPYRNFGPVRSLSLWRSAQFEIARITLSALWACQITLVVARCLCWDKYHCCTVLILIIKDILRRALDQQILPRGPLQRFCQDSSYRELLQRSQKEILPRDLL